MSSPSAGRSAQYVAEQVAEAYEVEVSHETSLRVLDAVIDLVAVTNEAHQADRRTGENEAAVDGLTEHEARHLFAAGLISVLQTALGARPADPDEPADYSHEVQP